MDFLQKLDILMQERGITRGGLAEHTGIPYNTIVGFYTKGYKNCKLSTLKKLAAYFSISLDMLCDDTRELESDDETPTPEIAQRFSALSPKAQRIVTGVIDGLMDLSAPEKAPIRLEYIREYVTPAAAGYASPAEGEDFVLVPKGPEVPKNADFAVRIDGDSMEPYIQDGSRVYVSRQTELTDGDVGIFFADGDMKCKQYCEDNLGNIYLFSLNRKRKDADMAFPADSGLTVFCFGKVLLSRRPPLPVD